MDDIIISRLQLAKITLVNLKIFHIRLFSTASHIEILPKKTEIMSLSLSRAILSIVIEIAKKKIKDEAKKIKNNNFTRSNRKLVIKEKRII